MAAGFSLGKGFIMNILFLGDIVGRPGRTAVMARVPSLREEFSADLVIANGENASGGLGITAKVAGELLASGIDVLTMGNHVWRYRDVYGLLSREERILRPGNQPVGSPGRGAGVYEAAGARVGVVNLQGRTFMQPIDCPFAKADELLAGLENEADVVLVDFHAEATSEKAAMGWHLDGRASALVGTHTHVQTSDGRVLPGGLGFLTDAGMCGPRDGCLGMKADPIIKRYMTGLPERFEVAGGVVVLQGALFQLDPSTGRAVSVQVFSKEVLS